MHHPLFFLTLPLATVFSLSTLPFARAQITPDNSLGAESSVVTPNVQIKDIPSDRIDGGAIRGANLFHSFQEFNINAGRGAYFSNPQGIANILTRVTGGNVSNIQGVLGVLGKANLFLINPNGIIFGPNARLDVGGSFLGSTANSLIFKDGFEFSATNPQAPPLLTINVPIGLGFRNNPQPIIVQGFDTSGSAAGLQVPSENSLTLVGGNVSVDRGFLSFTGGRIELGGLSAAGTLGLNSDGSLSFPNGVALADISLINGSVININGGAIAINARNLELSGGSFLNARVSPDFETRSVGANSTNIQINATNTISIDNSVLFNSVRPDARNDTGNIELNTKNLSLRNGGYIAVATFGEGTAGSIRINAVDSVSVDGIDKDGFSSGIFTQVGQEGVGNAGNIELNTTNLSLTNGGLIDSGTFGRGNAGSIRINARDSVSIDGVDKDGFSSGIFSRVGQGGRGNAGSIEIATNSLSVTNGAQISASTRGQGNAGNISVRASDSVSLVNGNIFSTVEAGGVGKSGNININAASLSLKDGAQLLTLVRGASDTQPGARGDAGNVTIDVTGPVTIAGVKDGFRSGIFSDVDTGATGNGGNITISSGSFSLSDGGRLSTSVFGQGNAGNILVRASGAVSLVNANIFSTVEAGGVGNGGNINILAASLSLKDGAQLLTLIRGASSTQPGAIGNGGDVTIDVTGPVTIAGVKDGFSSGIGSLVGTGVVGNGGNITITSGSFSLSDGAQLNASTSGQGNGGNISVRASDLVELAGSNTGIFSTVGSTGVGSGGNLTVSAKRFNVLNGAQGTVGNLGNGNAGDLKVIANSINLDHQGKLTADSANGIGGNIILQARDLLLLRRNSEISATSGTPGSAGQDGNIKINTEFLVGFPQENSDIVATGFGRTPGSNVQLNAPGGIFGIQYRPQLTPDNDIVATGTVTLTTLNIDPTRGLFELLETIPDPAQQLAQNPCIKGFGSTFTIVGRGGLPTDPKKILSSDNVRVDLIKPVPSTVSSTSTTQKQPTQKPPVKEIIPARGWIFNEKGEVLLVGYDPTKTGPQRQQPAPASSCAAVK